MKRTQIMSNGVVILSHKTKVKIDITIKTNRMNLVKIMYKKALKEDLVSESFEENEYGESIMDLRTLKVYGVNFDYGTVKDFFELVQLD